MADQACEACGSTKDMSHGVIGTLCDECWTIWNRLLATGGAYKSDPVKTITEVRRLEGERDAAWSLYKISERQVDRLQRGNTIESDFITKREFELMGKLEEVEQALKVADGRRLEGRMLLRRLVKAVRKSRDASSGFPLVKLDCLADTIDDYLKRSGQLTDILRTCAPEEDS